MSESKINFDNPVVPSLLGIIYKFGDWLISLLQIYILINSAMVGWILTTKPTWQILQKAIVIVVYSLAITINFVWLHRLHLWIKRIAEEIKTVKNETELISYERKINSIIDTVREERWWRMFFAFHVITHIAVLICILALTG